MGDIDLRSVRNFLHKRYERNGDPKIVAIRVQHLKDYLIPPLHKNSYHEHLEQIFLSLVRLASGDLYEKDHWEQIAENALIALDNLIEMENSDKSCVDKDENYT